MKRIFALFLAVLLLPVSSLASGLFEVQKYIHTHAPVSMDERHFILSGEIVDIYSINVNNHWDMIVKSDEENAVSPLWSEYPYFTAHFRLHLDECPFKVGDMVTVEGTVSPVYSSFAVPYIIVSMINGSDEY